MYSHLIFFIFSNSGSQRNMFRSSLGNNIKSDSGNKKNDACEFGRLRLFGPCAAFFFVQELEMLKYNNMPLRKYKLDIYIQFDAGKWVFRNVAATMLPKPSDSYQPNNRRFVAVLKDYIWNIFSDCFPTDCGWWRMNNAGMDDAFVVLECLSSKSLGMECSNMGCNFGLDEGVWPHRVQPAVRRTTATRRPTLLLHFVVGNSQWIHHQTRGNRTESYFKQHSKLANYMAHVSEDPWLKPALAWAERFGRMKGNSNAHISLA